LVFFRSGSETLKWQSINRLSFMAAEVQSLVFTVAAAFQQQTLIPHFFLQIRIKHSKKSKKKHMNMKNNMKNSWTWIKFQQLKPLKILHQSHKHIISSNPTLFSTLILDFVPITTTSLQIGLTNTKRNSNWFSQLQDPDRIYWLANTSIFHGFNRGGSDLDIYFAGSWSFLSFLRFTSDFKQR
jgi:hypothetical protein